MIFHRVKFHRSWCRLAIANSERLLRTSISMNKSLYSYNKKYVRNFWLWTPRRIIRIMNEFSATVCFMRFHVIFNSLMYLIHLHFCVDPHYLKVQNYQVLL